MYPMKLSRRGPAWIVAVLGFVGAMAGCTPDYVNQNSAPVNLYIVEVTSGGGSETSGGAVVHSDVLTQGTDLENPKNTICPDFAIVSAAVRNKNPLAPAPAVASAVIVDSYAVRYTRTDGRGVEGVDVPYRITGQLTVAIDVATAGSTDIPIEIVRHQAKVEPPLSTVFQTSVLTTIAEITLWGHTIAGESVSAVGYIQVNFANFGDTGTCTQG